MTRSIQSRYVRVVEAVLHAHFMQQQVGRDRVGIFLVAHTLDDNRSVESRALVNGSKRVLPDLVHLAEDELSQREEPRRL